MEELVTIVVPIYQVEKYLDRCVGSIVNQTYRNLEIILVDDGSFDRCPQMCDEWAKRDSRIKVIHKENAGLGMARNTGIENATGKYICFFDSDDYVDITTVEKAYRLAQTEQVDIVLFGTTSVDNSGNVIKATFPQADKTHYAGDDVRNIILPDLIESSTEAVKVKDLFFSACGCLFSMDLIKKTNWRFVSERQIISEDCYSLIWLYKYVESVAILPEALYFYRANEASLTHVYRADRFEKCKQFYSETLKLADEAGFCDEVYKRISGLFVSFVLAAMKMIVMSDMESAQKRKLIAEIVKDKTMQKALAKCGNRYKSKPKKLLVTAMRMKMCGLVYFFVKMRAS